MNIDSLYQMEVRSDHKTRHGDRCSGPNAVGLNLEKSDADLIGSARLDPLEAYILACGL